MNKLHFTPALAVGALCAWWWIALPGKDGVAQAPQPQSVQPAAEPSLNLQVGERGLATDSTDLFAPPPAPPPPPRVVVAAAAPPAPQAPPLPYRYNGSGMWQGKPIVFLLKGNKSFMVSAGDTLEGTYAVEALARDHLVLRYLPLAIRQVLPYEGGVQLPVDLAVPQALALQIDMPGEVVVGDEFVVAVSLSGGAALKGTVEVGYDTEVLAAIGTNMHKGGRAVVTLAGGRAQVRFKVLADTPASSELQLQVNALDANGKPVPVSVPPAQAISFVLPGGGG